MLDSLISVLHLRELNGLAVLDILLLAFLIYRFLLIVRGIMLKGVGLAELWQETVILAGMTAVVLVASVRAFDMRLG